MSEIKVHSGPPLTALDWRGDSVRADCIEDLAGSALDAHQAIRRGVSRHYHELGCNLETLSRFRGRRCRLCNRQRQMQTGWFLERRFKQCPHEEAVEQVINLLKDYRLNRLDSAGAAWLIGFCEGFKEELEQNYAPKLIRGPMTENRKRYRQLIQDYLDLKMTLAEFDAASKDIPVDWL